MEVIIRNAEDKDFDEVYPLFHQLWPNKEINKDELMKVFCRGVESKSDELLCAVLDGSMVGFCSYGIMNNFWQEGYIAYISCMVVDEKHRGEGVGNKLISEAINKAKERGCKRVELDSGFPREQAHRFYENLGFEKRAFLFSMIL